MYLFKKLSGWLAMPLMITICLSLAGLGSGRGHNLAVWNLILINIIVVIGLDVLMGFCGQLSLGQGVFVAIGAYSVGICTVTFDLNGWIGLIFGIFVSGIAAAMLGFLVLRLRGYYLAIATLGLPVIFNSLMRSGGEWTGGGSGLIGIPELSLFGFLLDNDIKFFWFLVFVVFLILCGAWYLSTSRWAAVLRIVGEDEPLAASRGINTTAVKVSAFVASAALGAIAGGLYVYNVSFVGPDSFGLMYSLTIVIMLLIGGMGRLWGGIIGVVLLSWLPQLLGGAENWEPVIYGGVLVFVIVLSPGGIANIIKRKTIRQITRDKNGGLVDIECERVNRRLCGKYDKSSLDIVLQATDLGKRFGGVTAVRNGMVTLNRGKICALIGPNGSGKSTTLALLGGQIASDSGKVIFEGNDISNLPVYRRARLGLSRTFQHCRVGLNLSVYENLLIGLSACSSRSIRRKRLRDIKDLIEFAGLTAKRNVLATELNYFELRMLEVASALVAKPSVLLVDEPGAGLDDREIEIFINKLNIIKASGVAVLLVDHVMSLIKAAADELMVYEDGEVKLKGQPEEVLADTRVREIYLGALT